MRLAQILVVCAAVALAPAAMAQKWEFGGGVGEGFYTSRDVNLGSSSAAAKVENNLAGSAWLTNNGQGRWGGELRYDYQKGALQLTSGGVQASFAGMSHAMHYDVLWYASPNGSRIRPFVAVGAGVKIYQGTGTEVVYQPLSQFALLTKDQDLTPLVSVGAGFKFQLSPRISFRLDVHDYLTPFPNKVITPNQGAKVGGWTHDIVPMGGISVALGKVE